MVQYPLIDCDPIAENSAAGDVEFVDALIRALNGTRVVTDTVNSQNERTRGSHLHSPSFQQQNFPLRLVIEFVGYTLYGTLLTGHYRFMKYNWATKFFDMG